MYRDILICTAILAGLSLPACAQSAPRLSPQDLNNLVAPVALYPDMLLSELLAASTYPLELAEAQQWMQANAGLRGRALLEAAKQQNWDPSVQALVAFPDVMNLLTRDIQWTSDLGNAFLSNQAGLMDAIQGLRAAARDNGRLTDTPQQRVTYEQQNGQDAIVIQPTDPQVIYPPVYNPEYVWGPPAYGVYPSLGYPALGYPGDGWGITYGVATFLGALFTGLLSFGGWGWGLSWLTHGLFLNGLFFSHFGFHGYSGYGFNSGYAARAAWVHDPAHRLGVPYGGRYASRNAASGGNQRFANFAGRSYTAPRADYRDSGYRGYNSQGARQMDAYRGLAESASRAGGYGRGYPGGGTERGWSQPSRSSNFRESASRYSAPRYSAPKTSGHVSSGRVSSPHFKGGGGGHFKGGGGHSHSGGGGHSHGGHKK